MRMLIFLSIIILFFIIHINANTFNDTEITYPPYWHIAPSSLSEFPLINDSFSQYRLIDPWFYPHRLGLYKILINVTTPFMPFCSSSNASNILFALPSQFGWQFSSNRLFTNGTMNISTNSWWASANYYLSVIPFLVAVDIGLIHKEPFRILRQNNFCSSSTECFRQIPHAMEQWYLFFLHLTQSASCISNKKLTQRIIEKCYLQHIWTAYKSSIYNALPLVESKLDYLPSEVEKLFGLGWARFINLISMTRKNTDLYETIRNQRKFLPFRMLKESDRKPESNDLPDLVNRSLKNLLSFRFDWLLFIEKIWSRITCNYEGRIYAQYTLETMALSKLLASTYLAKAIMNAFLYKCDRLSNL
ncbi:unnamed protein product [Adineta steineri]|uniref:Uncharacterized protein n=1 Tax=Adineta steineri TaxID=433720 RepID=A0A813XAQ0_9BILA|nr:unnamed protein product [Adineta steineri]CAF0867843.1 unnamed protein product [Adineta steineri]